MSKDAKNDHPLHPLLKQRWSPRAFANKAVEPQKLLSVLEAARWCASAGNQQPWRFIVGLKGDDTHQEIFGTLDRGNQRWAGHAPVLLITCGRTYANDDQEINNYYAYDTGQSAAHMSIQAMAEGLYVHQMGGFDPVLARERFAIPEIFQPLSVIAIGYLGDPETLDDFNKKRELAERSRKALKETVFSETFGNPASCLP